VTKNSSSDEMTIFAVYWDSQYNIAVTSVAIYASKYNSKCTSKNLLKSWSWWQHLTKFAVLGIFWPEKI